MPRIRTIKPEFWNDEKMAALPPLTRLVFLGLISMADDYGRLVDNVKSLDGMLFPVTDDSCESSLDSLATLQRITRYTSEAGQKLIQINHWSAHQKVNHCGKEVYPSPQETVKRPARKPRENRKRVAGESLASYQRPTTNDLLPTTFVDSSESNGKTTPEKAPSWVAEGTDWWKANIGAMTYGHFGRALKDEVGSRGWPQVFAAMKCYAANHGRARPAKLDWFAEEMVKWVEYSTMNVTDENGNLTPLGRALTEQRQ